MSSPSRNRRAVRAHEAASLCPVMGAWFDQPCHAWLAILLFLWEQAGMWLDYKLALGRGKNMQPFEFMQ